MEIDEELVDGIEKVLERRGEMKDLSMKQRLDKVAVEIKQILEETLSGEPKEKVEEHNCKENIDYGKPDWRFSRFEGDTVIFYGNCSVCGKKLRQIYEYVETRDNITNEIIDPEKEVEDVFFVLCNCGIAYPDKTQECPACGLENKPQNREYIGRLGREAEKETEKEKAYIQDMLDRARKAVDKSESFIHADKWREMTANDIISSVDIGLSVLKEKEGFSKEYHGQLLVLIEEIAKMLAREV